MAQLDLHVGQRHRHSCDGDRIGGNAERRAGGRASGVSAGGHCCVAGDGHAHPGVREVASPPPRDHATQIRARYEAWLIEAMGHGDNDSYWANMGASAVDHIAEYQDVPSYHVTGWYALVGAQVANLNYVELSKAKKSLQRLIVGPWTHGGQNQSFSGIAEFGPAAALDMNAFRQRWFDRWLLGLPTGVDREPPVRLFVMGGGDARDFRRSAFRRWRLARGTRVATGSHRVYPLLLAPGWNAVARTAGSDVPADPVCL